MKKHFSILFFIAINCIAVQLHAQTDTIINGKHYTVVDNTKPTVSTKKRKTPVDSTFILNDKRLKYYNSWVTGGAGVQQNLKYTKRKVGFAGGLDFNFHIKQQYFQLGTIITGEKFGFYDNYQFHLGYGKRYEDKDFHASGFVGISYSTGYGKIDSTGTYERPFKAPGIYIEGQFVKKISYDVGIGVSIFADYNQEQAIAGARLILYFSGAYKGKANGAKK